MQWKGRGKKALRWGDREVKFDLPKDHVKGILNGSSGSSPRCGTEGLGQYENSWYRAVHQRAAQTRAKHAFLASENYWNEDVIFCIFLLTGSKPRTLYEDKSKGFVLHNPV